MTTTALLDGAKTTLPPILDEARRQGLATLWAQNTLWASESSVRIDVASNPDAAGEIHGLNLYRGAPMSDGKVRPILGGTSLATWRGFAADPVSASALVRISRGLYVSEAEAVDAGNPCRRIDILDSRGRILGTYEWSPTPRSVLYLTGRRVSAGTRKAVYQAIGAMHRTSRLICRADCALEAANRLGDAPSAEAHAMTALAVIRMPGFPPDIARAVPDRVAALCAAHPCAPWAMRLLARLGAEAA